MPASLKRKPLLQIALQIELPIELAARLKLIICSGFCSVK